MKIIRIKNIECELKYELRIFVKLFIWMQNAINIIHMKYYIEYFNHMNYKSWIWKGYFNSCDIDMKIKNMKLNRIWINK